MKDVIRHELGGPCPRHRELSPAKRGGQKPAFGWPRREGTSAPCRGVRRGVSSNGYCWRIRLSPRERGESLRKEPHPAQLPAERPPAGIRQQYQSGKGVLLPAPPPLRTARAPFRRMQLKHGTTSL